MSPNDIEALIRLLDDPRLGPLAEEQLIDAGPVVIPSLHAYADLAPTIANQLLKRIQATDHDLAWARLAKAPSAEEGVFLISECLDPFFDGAPSRSMLDEMAQPLHGTLYGETRDYHREALALRDWLSLAKRFRANRGDYYSPNNLLLPQVIETRLGVPLSLCLVYLLIGRRVGAPVYMIELPHHLVVRYGEEPGAVFIDPYHDGALMSEKECRAVVQQLGMALQETAFLPLSDYDIVERLLRALAAVYTQRRETKLQHQIERYRTIWRGNSLLE